MIDLPDAVLELGSGTDALGAAAQISRAAPPLPEGATVPRLHVLLGQIDPLAALAGLHRDGRMASVTRFVLPLAKATPAVLDWTSEAGFRVTAIDAQAVTLDRDARLIRLPEAEAELKHLDQRFRAARTQADQAIRASKSDTRAREEAEAQLALMRRDLDDLAARLHQSETRAEAQAALLRDWDALIDRALDGEA